MRRKPPDPESAQNRSILLVIPSLGGGGAERVCARLSKIFFASGLNVTIVTFFPEITPAYDYSGTLAPISRPRSKWFKSRWLNGFARIIGLTRIIRQTNPDLILSFMESANIPAMMASALTGQLSRLKVSIRTDPRRIPAAEKFLARISYRFATKVVVNSQGAADVLLAEWHYRPEHVQVIYNPITDDIASDAGAASEPCMVPGKCFAFVGRLSPEKQPLHAIQAFQSAALTDPWRLVLVGEGPLRPEIDAYIRTHNLQSKVILLGWRKNIPAILRDAHAMIMTSDFEGWPNSMNEALAIGCPVLAYDFRFGPAEALSRTPGHTIVPAQDIEAMAKAIRKSAGEPRLQAAMNAGLRARFMPETVALQWLATDPQIGG